MSVAVDGGGHGGVAEAAFDDGQGRACGGKRRLQAVRFDILVSGVTCRF
jgi:hypothetical protein